MQEPIDEQLAAFEREVRKNMPELLARTPRLEDTFQLIRRLQPEFDTLKHLEEDTAFNDHRVRPSLARLIRTQLTLYRLPFWLGSLGIFAMLLVIGNTSNTLAGFGYLFSLLLPMLMLSGLAYSMRAWSPSMRLIESITPYPPALLFISRWLIVVLLNLGFGLTGTVYMAWSDKRLPVLPFLLSWLTPLLLVSGFLGAILLRRGPRAAVATAIGVWLAELTLHERLMQLRVLTPSGELLWQGILSLIGIGLFVSTLLFAIRMPYSPIVRNPR